MGDRDVTTRRRSAVLAAVATLAVIVASVALGFGLLLVTAAGLLVALIALLALLVWP